jgi:hypothetical protein
MKLTLERFGGIAAIRKPPLVVDTAKLSKSDAERIETLASQVLSARKPSVRARAPAPPPAPTATPDAVSYELAISADDAEHSLSFDHTTAGDTVQQLVAALRAAAKA